MHYSELSLTRNPDYKGATSVWSEEEASQILLELIAYFGEGRGLALPMPPDGLPGATSKNDDDLGIKRVIDLGFDYFHSVIKGEARRLHNIWKEIEEFERDAYWRGYNRRKEQEQEEYLASAVIHRTPEEIAAALQDDRYVYFVASDSGPIKIGLASNVEARIKSLQTAHPFKLTLLATSEGGQAQERDYHTRFAAHRLHGEWFARCPDIEAEIERLNPIPPLHSCGRSVMGEGVLVPCMLVMLWCGFWFGHYFGAKRSADEKSKIEMAERILEDAKHLPSLRRLVGEGPAVSRVSAWRSVEAGSFKIAVCEPDPTPTRTLAQEVENGCE